MTKVVEIDPQSGFCFGVVYAIQMAEDFLDENGQLYCLGDIVHNDEEVNRLKSKGLQIINHDKFKELSDVTVLIRAHGEPPETYMIALKNNITLIDASCPVVLKLQNRVRKSHEKNETQIIIYGKKGHAEVNGLIGQTNGKAVVISSPDELDALDFSQPIELFSQTTKSTEKFYQLAMQMEGRASHAFKANDTICRQVSNREPQLIIFSGKYEVIIFVSGVKSSNGKVLYDVCKSVNPKSYFVSSESELLPEWFRDIQTVGICGATSTPMWLMENVRNRIVEIMS